MSEARGCGGVGRSACTRARVCVVVVWKQVVVVCVWEGLGGWGLELGAGNAPELQAGC